MFFEKGKSLEFLSMNQIDSIHSTHGSVAAAKKQIKNEHNTNSLLNINMNVSIVQQSLLWKICIRTAFLLYIWIHF